jgi:glycosyltransferase involved in cell wall biosynthesis
MDRDIFVIVTAYNEADSIAATLDALARELPQARVLLADDGSTDATAQIAAAHGAHVIRSERMVGKGEAATQAAREALSAAAAQREQRGESVFLLCDGDLGDCAGELVALVRAVEEGQAELAVAVFRTRLGGGVGLALGFARWAIRRRCGLEAAAPISGQRALSERALCDVLPFAHGFGMEIGMTIDAVRAGNGVVEIELDLSHRASGRTLRGFIHRGRQLFDFARVYAARRNGRAGGQPVDDGARDRLERG